eukprot:6404027-Amphidinium_carterae.1
MMKHGYTKGDTLGDTKVGTLCQNDETTSVSMDCLQEDLTKSEDDEISWASLDLVGGTDGYNS